MKFLNIKQVAEKAGISRSAIYLLISAGKFPKQVRVGKKSSRWFESEIEGWMGQQPRSS